MIKELLKQEYGLTVEKVEMLEKRSINKQHIIYAKEGKFFLKEQGFLKGGSKKLYQNQLAIAHHLHKKGVSVFLPIKAVNGEELVQKGKSFFTLYDFVELDQDVDTSDSDLYMEAARILADFHVAMKDFKTSIPFDETPLHKDIDSITRLSEHPYNFKSESIIALVRKSKHPLANRIKEDLPMLYKAINKVVHHMWNANYSMETIVHYDCNPGNIFFSNGQLLAISDFELSHKGYIESDVVKAAKFWSENTKTGEIDIRRFKHFIMTYKKFNPQLIVDWTLFCAMTLYIVLRRLMYASEYTITGRGDLTFLYDIDIKLVDFLMRNDFN